MGDWDSGNAALMPVGGPDERMSAPGAGVSLVSQLLPLPDLTPIATESGGD